MSVGVGGHVGRTVKNGGGEMERREEEWELEEEQEEEEGGRRKRYVWRRGRGGSGEGREGRRGVGGGESMGVEDDEKKSSQLTVMVARYYTHSHWIDRQTDRQTEKQTAGTPASYWLAAG